MPFLLNGFSNLSRKYNLLIWIKIFKNDLNAEMELPFDHKGLVIDWYSAILSGISKKLCEQIQEKTE
jgi:hypothetical protein